MKLQELPFSSNRKSETNRGISAIPKQKRKELIIFADGASRGNPGEAGAGVLILDQAGKIVQERKIYLGNATNNVAEYKALILALQKAWQLGATNIRIFMDSELVVRQLQGEYKVRNMNLKPLYEQARDLLNKFANYSIKFIKRENNKKADKLANEAIQENSRKKAK